MVRLVALVPLDHLLESGRDRVVAGVTDQLVWRRADEGLRVAAREGQVEHKPVRRLEGGIEADVVLGLAGVEVEAPARGRVRAPKRWQLVDDQLQLSRRTRQRFVSAHRDDPLERT